MNCQEFEFVVNDLIRLDTSESEAHRNALAHAETCAKCRLRLVDERNLTIHLRQAADTACAAALVASPLIEARLLQAFRERTTLPATEAHLPQVAPLWLTNIVGSFRWTTAVAAVAVVIVLIAFTTMFLPQQPSSPSERAARQADNPQPSLTPTQQHISLPSSIQQIDAGDEAVDEELLLGRQPSIHRASLKERYASSQAKRSNIADSSKNASASNKPNTLTAGSEMEITTDFFPMMGNSSEPLESGRMVRVELPRSALVSFGLPMNMERAHEPIKADVLLGDDGMARALRFVNYSNR